MKNNRIFIFIMVTIIALNLSACTSKTEVNLTFSEYYQNADDYEKIYPLLNEYFTCIQNAYDESDKENFDTFKLPEKYSDITSQLSTISNDDSGMIINGSINTSDEYLARIQLMNPYLQIEVHLREKELLETSNSSSEEWFSELNTLLTDSYSEYQDNHDDK